MLYYILFVSTATIYKLPVCSSTSKPSTSQPTQESTIESKCDKVCEYC